QGRPVPCAADQLFAPLAEVFLAAIGISKIMYRKLQFLLDPLFTLRNFPSRLFWRHLRKERVADGVAAEVNSASFHQADLIRAEHLALRSSVIRDVELPKNMREPLLAVRLPERSQESEDFTIGLKPV